jgi:tyrosyl-tRNA synthetase
MKTNYEVNKDVIVDGVKAVDLFTEYAPIFATKAEMRKLVYGGMISLNKEKLTVFDKIITVKDLIDDKYLLVQRGKKNYYLITVK